VNLLNPKTAIFFYAFLPQFIDPGRGATTRQILFLGGHFALMATCTDSLYALLASTVGQWLNRSAHFLRVQRYVTGTISIALGITAAVTDSEKK
jgi:threonine/homoserine/homoserine lactone efflux protein